MAYGTVSNGLSASTTEVSVGDEFGVELKIPAISDPLATIEFNISFPKDAFEVVAYEKPAFATTYSTVSDANSIGRITCSDFSASGDNDLTTLQAGGTISATLKVKDTAKAGQAYKIEVTLYTVDKIDEETYDSVDCAPAGVVKTVTITVKGNTPAHEHVWSEAWSKDATHHWHDCTAAGCDAANADKNGYAAHNYNKKVTTKDYLKTAANCTDAAVYYYSCECGAIGTKTFTDGTALGHNPSTEWSKDATHHWHVCTTCNAELDKAAHNPGPAATETTPQTCTVCGYEIVPVLPHTHNYVEVAEAKYLKTAASCTSPAVYYKSCSKCHEVGTETFEYGTALGHSYTAEKAADQYLKTAATCTEDAVYFKSCARCGDKGTETFTATGTALGHVQASPWAHNDTEHWQVCTRCNEAFNKAAHNGGTATCQEMAKCEICGAAYGKLGEHNFDTKWTSDDTYHYHKCLTAGCTEKADDAAKHSSTGANEANCLHKAKCDVCAAEYGDLGAHVLTKTAAKAPTCLEAGNNEYYTCSVCGKVFKDAAGTTETTVAAETLAKSTTHVVESKYVTNATEHFKTCSVCGTEIENSRAKHTFVKDETTGVETCSVCGYAIGGKVDENHQHAAGNDWFRDENNHWHKCTDPKCTAHVDEAKHDFETVSTTKDGNKTTTVEKCKTCGYVKTTTVDNTPVTPVNPTKPGRPSGTKTVQSGKTFDAGVGVYVGLSILSLTGSAVVIGKKRKTR